MNNAPRTTTDISRCLAPLREVVSSLLQARSGTVPAGADRAKLVRRARAAGPAVVLKLIASLSSKDEPEAGWAYHLLARVGGARVIQALERLCASDANDTIKARALGLLSDLQAPMPSEPPAITAHGPYRPASIIGGSFPSVVIAP